MPKYVVARTLDEPTWSNSTALKGDLAEAVSLLDGELLVAGSRQLVQTLLEHDLVDELRASGDDFSVAAES